MDLDSRLRVWAWGDGREGQLGQETDIRSSNVPVQVGALVGTSVKVPICGPEVSAVISGHGRLFTWGDRVEGDGDLDDREPSELDGIDDPLVELQFGSRHRIALTERGEVFTWGLGTYGRCGNDCWDYEYEPAVIESLQRKFIHHVAAGPNHCIAVTDEGMVYTWGAGNTGQLGHGDSSDQVSPKKVQGLLKKKIRKVACGNDFTAAITELGEVYTWGFNAAGQLGHGNTEDVWEPRLVKALDGKPVKQIACGYYHTAALTETGEVYTWGSGTSGKLGQGDAQSHATPQIVKGLRDETTKEIACGWNHTAAVTSNGTLFTWGYGRRGRLGHGDENSRASPTLVKGLSNVRVSHVSCGAAHTLAITSQ